MDLLSDSVNSDENERFFSEFSFSFMCDPESLCALSYFENEIHFQFECNKTTQEEQGHTSV